MIVRSKTKKRLVLLVSAFAVVAGLLIAGVIYRLAQVRNRFEGYRRDGLQAFAQGDFNRAVNQLGRYVKEQKYSEDAEAVYHLAEAATRIDSLDGGHIEIAKRQYQRFLELRPERGDVRLKLLRLCREHERLAPDALNVADKILQVDPSNQEALAVKAWAQVWSARPAEAIDTALRAVADKTGDPTDIRTQALLIQLYREPRHEAAARRDPLAGASVLGPSVTVDEVVIGRARALLKAHPDNAGFEALLAGAYSMVRQLTPRQRDEVRADLGLAADAPADYHSAARFHASRAARGSIADPAVSRILVLVLDAVGMPQQRLDVLSRLEAEGVPWSRRLLLRGLYESGRYADLEQRLARLDLPLNSPEKVEAVGLRALALIRLDRLIDARLIAERLEAAQNSRHAAAWAGAIRYELCDETRRAAQAKALQQALGETLPESSAFLWFYRGEALRQLQEREQAAAAYRAAASLAPGWALPISRLALLAAQGGEFLEAAQFALRAFALAPSIEAESDVLNTAAAALGSERLAGATELLSAVRRVQERRPLERRTLPLYLRLLEKNGQRDQAQAVLRSAAATRPAMDESSLLNLAMMSRQLNLGDPEPLFAASQQAHGGSPSLAYARAYDLHLQGKADQARAAMESAYASRKPGAELNWAINRARLFDLLGDDKAAGLWIALADDPANRDNALVQRLAMSSPVVRGNSEFLKRATDRLRALTGDKGVAWKLSQARILLGDNATESDIAEAVRLLKDASASAPNDFEARGLLTQALFRAGDLRAATDQATEAVRRRPTQELRVMLAQLASLQGDWGVVREQLKAIESAKLAPSLRFEAARLHLHAGDAQAGLALLQRDPGDDLLANTLLAELHRACGDNTRAHDLYQSLLQRKDLIGPREVLLLSAADFYAATARPSDARKLLDGLSSLKLAPGAAEAVWGEFELRHGTPAAAIARYEASLKAEPRNAAAWRGLMLAHLRAQNPQAALDAGQRAAVAIPASRALAVFQQEASLLSESAKQSRLQPLLAALVRGAADQPVLLEALRVSSDASRARLGPVESVSRLRAVSDRAPRLLSLRVMLVQEYVAIGRADEALRLAEQIAAAQPASEEHAELLAQVAASAGQLTRALDAGKRWRDITRAAPLTADVFLAQVHRRLGQPDEALKCMEPYLAAAAADPDALRMVHTVRSLALIEKGDADQAAEIIWPLISRNVYFRVLWIEQSLLLKDAAAALQRLQRIERTLGPDATDERAALASAYYRLSTLPGMTAHRADARRILADLIPRAGANPLPVFTLGLIDETEGKLADAEKSYRRTIELAPAHTVALNNLAMVVATRDGDLDEARAFAQRAVDLAPGVANFQDTLGTVLMKRKEYKAAVEPLRQAVRLDPRNLSFKARLVLALHGAGDAAESQRLVDEIGPGASSLPEELRQQLDAIRRRPGTVP